MLLPLNLKFGVACSHFVDGAKLIIVHLKVQVFVGTIGVRTYIQEDL